MDFQEYLQIVLSRARTAVTYGTWKEYDIIARLNLSRLTGALESVTEQDCIEVLCEAKKKYSIGRQRKIYFLLNRVFREAKQDGCIQYNPMTYIKQPKKPKKLYQVYSAEEVRQMIACKTDTVTKAIVLIELYSGLRRGEVLALKWDSVCADLSREEPNGYLLIHRAVVLCDGGVRIEETTKGRTDRTIPIKSEIYNILQQLAMENGMQGLLFKRKTDSNMPMSYHEYHHRWRDFVQTLQAENPSFRYLTPHKLRHTFATQMLASGADIESLRDLMGHSDIQTTEKYLHTNAERYRKCMDMLSYSDEKDKKRP